MLANYYLIFFALACACCTAIEIPTASSWLQYNYWSDSSCSVYAGEYAIGMGECYPNSLKGTKSVKYVPTLNGTIYTLTSTYYSDANCTVVYLVHDHDYYDTRCTDTGLGYYYSAALLSAKQTTFVSSGLLTGLYESQSDCSSGAGLMAYMYQVYNTTICYPWIDNHYLHVVDCETSTYGSKSSSCTGTANTETSFACSSRTASSTLGWIFGYPSAKCVDGTAK